MTRLEFHTISGEQEQYLAYTLNSCLFLLGEAIVQSPSQINQGLGKPTWVILRVAAGENSPVGCPIPFQNTQQAHTDDAT